MSKLPENTNPNATPQPAPAPSAPDNSSAPNNPAAPPASATSSSPVTTPPSTSSTTNAPAAPASTSPASSASSAPTVAAQTTPLASNLPVSATPTPASPSEATPAPTTAKSPAPQPQTTANPAKNATLPMQVATGSSSPTSESKTPSNVNFSADKIGQWASKQESPFAAQNRKTAAEREDRAKSRRKALPFIVAGIFVALLLIVGVIALIIAFARPSNKVEAPEIYGSSERDIYEYQDALTKIYQDNDNNLDAVSEAVNKTLNTESGKQNADQVRLAEAFFYASNSEYRQAIDSLANVSPANLSIEQQVMYYDTLYYGNIVLGNQDLADEYFQKSYELRVELGGSGG